jgi:hypothetical protein
VEAGDRLRLSILRPDGSLLIDSEIRIERNRARQFRYAGKRKPPASWEPGIYRARTLLIRTVDGQPTNLVESERSITLE